jgi:hypothetical protein
MNKAKPFLLGTLMGAAALFVALQYHVVRSHDGFQLVPRTPQHSIGLAYADVRNWEASDWMDRPELARALFAHGSSDLISQSVTASLAESVTSESATLDQLQQLLNRSDTDSGTGDSGFLKLPPRSESDSNQNDRDLFAIPFPTAASTSKNDPFRIADSDRSDPRAATPERAAPTSQRRESPLAEGSDQLRSGAATRRSVPRQTTPQRFEDSFTEQLPGGPLPQTGRSSETQRAAAAVEELIFGADSTTEPSTSRSGTGSDRAQTGTGTPFDEITTELENRARTALQRAQSSLEDSARESIGDAANATDRFVRGKLDNGTAAMFGTDDRDSPAPVRNETLQRLRENFDPFIQ